MFGIGGFELFLILLFGFLIFGPDKLPAIAKTIGQALAKFRSAQEEMNKVIKTEVYDPNSDEPFKNPLDALEKLGDAGKSAVTGKPSASKAAEKKPQEKQESFSERKARYDKERAAKKAAEAEAASEPASAQSAKAEASAKPATASAPAEQAAESAIEEKKGE